MRDALLERGYVAGTRAARRAARGVGLLDWLERRRASRVALWARSLFAIHDIDDLAHLDLPWWNFAAIDAVDAFLRSRHEARVWEYGSGSSTIWLARRAATVFSVEHDQQWAPIVHARLRDHPNASLSVVLPDAEPDAEPTYVSEKPAWRGRSFRQYVEAIDRTSGEFDLIVIDGRARVACLRHAKARLKADGMIVFDNSHRTAYRKAIAESGMTWQRLRGLSACLPYPDETTLLTQRA